MHLLGTVCESTNMPHVRDICTIEMAARSLKKIFRKQLADFMEDRVKEPVQATTEDTVKVVKRESAQSNLL